jgi:hypothetical protein
MKKWKSGMWIQKWFQICGDGAMEDQEKRKGVCVCERGRGRLGAILANGKESAARSR